MKFFHSIGAVLPFLFWLLAPPLLAAPPQDSAVVLMYHRFGEADYPSTNTSPELFDRQLDLLAQNGYRVLSLSTLIDHWRSGTPFPGPSVAITIDDAYLSVYRVAYPRLKRRGWPFTVFVSTDAVDRNFGDYMSWQQMREMQAHGAAFANHSTSHAPLIERGPEESEQRWRVRITADIEYAQQRLTEELGTPLRLFAYPYGEYDARLATLVSDLGYTSFGQHSGAIGPYSDPRALPRFPISDTYGQPEEFATKIAALALPVIEAIPWDPRLAGENPPLLTLRLTSGTASAARVTCYVDGKEIAVVRPPAQENTLLVKAEQPLSGRRSRYNCTAPSPIPGRYYWFSHPWLRVP